MSFLLEVFSAPKELIPFQNIVANDASYENITPNFDKYLSQKDRSVWAYVGSEQLYKLFDEALGQEEDLDDYSSHYIRLDRPWIIKLQTACRKLFKDSWREADQAFYHHFEKMVNKFYRSVVNGNREFYLYLCY